MMVVNINIVELSDKWLESEGKSLSLYKLCESERHPPRTPIYIEETFGLLSLKPLPTQNYIAK